MALCGLVLGIPQQSVADWLRFRAGGDILLPAEIDGDSVRLAAPARTYEFQKSDFSRIVPGHWPEHEWPMRLEAARPGGARTLYQAAWWALENGLTPEALSCLQEAFQADPSLTPVDRLHPLMLRLGVPLPDPDLARLHAGIPGEFQLARSDHLILLHQHPADEAESLLETLERVYATFYLCFTAQGFDLSLPDRRVVLIWYAREKPFQEQVRRESGRVMPTTRGYYSPSRDVVLLSDTRSTADHRRAESANQSRRAELERVSESLANLPAKARFRFEVGGEPPRTLTRAEAQLVVDRLGREVDRQELLLDLRRRAMDLGTACHELVHLLVAASGLLPRGGDSPLWFQEGLAMQFETVRGGRWAGLSRLHDIRLADYRRINPPPRLGSLLADEGLGHGYRNESYAAAWSFVYYLRKREPRVFVTLLDRYRAPTVFRPTPNELLLGLEESWHSFLASLQLPLDSDGKTAENSR